MSDCQCLHQVIIENFLVCESCGLCKENLFTSFIDKSYPYYNNFTLTEKHLYETKQNLESVLQEFGEGLINKTYCLYTKVYQIFSSKVFNSKGSNVRQGLLSACFYFACRILSQTREKKEIAGIFKVDIKALTKACNYFLDVMGDSFIQLEPNVATDFIPNYMVVLEIPKVYTGILYKVVSFLMSLQSFADNTPSSILCTGIYILTLHTDLSIPKKTIHKKCGTTVSILTKNYTKAEPFLYDLFSKLNTSSSTSN
jgi:hypothetical protein